MTQEAAIFVVNHIMENDPVLAEIFSPHELAIYPGYGDEAHDGVDSFPYIRYQFMPIPMRQMPYIRRDWCQYFVGDKDYVNVVNAIERIIYIFNIAISTEQLGWGMSDYSGKYNILDVLVHNATIPNIPSQDNGVWEQGVAFSLRYTVHQDWSGTKREGHGLDVKLQ